jgi:hypothetical protein
VFHELRGLPVNIYIEVIGGSIMMALGALAVSSSSASQGEYESWSAAARREIELYGLDSEYVTSRMQGHEVKSGRAGRSWIDVVLVTGVTAIFVWFATQARAPHMEMQTGWLALFAFLLIGVLAAGGWALWRVTRFS